jgi:hypothetical protein
MENERDTRSDERFEAYLREFRPARRKEQPQRARGGTTGLAQRSRLRLLLWGAGAAAAAVLLLAVIPRTSKPQETPEISHQSVPERVIELPTDPESLSVDEMVQYRTLAAAASEGTEALDRLLAKASPRLLVPVNEQNQADSALQLL